MHGLVLLVFLAIPQQDAPLPEGAIAEVNGKVVAAGDYYQWLVETQGWKFLDEYLTLVLLEQEARSRSLTVTGQEVDAAVEQYWKDNVMMRYGGDEARMLEELQQAGMTRETRLKMQRPKIHADTLAKKMIRGSRESTEAKLKTVFRQLFGSESQRLHLKVGYFDAFRSLAGKTASREEAEELKARCADRAERFLAQVRAEPGRFGELALAESDPLMVPRFDSYVEDLREKGGDLPYYQADLFQGRLAAPLATAQPGDSIGPVATGTGHYVACVIQRETVTFEAVREELLTEFRNRPVTAREIHFFKQELLTRAKLVRPHDFPPVPSQGDR